MKKNSVSLWPLFLLRNTSVRFSSVLLCTHILKIRRQKQTWDNTSYRFLNSFWPFKETDVFQTSVTTHLFTRLQDLTSRKTRNFDSSLKSRLYKVIFTRLLYFSPQRDTVTKFVVKFSTAFRKRRFSCSCWKLSCRKMGHKVVKQKWHTLSFLNTSRKKDSSQEHWWLNCEYV
jgi:hypothetical protein